MWLFSRKCQLATSNSLPNANSPNRVVTASGDSPASPQGGNGPSQTILLTRCSLARPTWEWPFSTQMAASESTRSQPPWGGGLGTPLITLPLCPSQTPYGGSLGGGAPFGAFAPEDWCRSVDPPGCPSPPPWQCKSPLARIQQPYVQPSQAPSSLIGVQSSGSCPMWRTDTTLDLSQ